MAQDKTEKRSIWNQRADDVSSNTDAATLKIFNQITGSGLVSAEQKKKGKK